jgi:c-di-GMP-binding flagellar brake protein YcgR
LEIKGVIFLVEQREYMRVKTRSILVSLANFSLRQPITGFLRDISAGGLKVQRISSMTQVQSGEYECQFVLPVGKITSQVEVLSSGGGPEKFSDLFMRMRFVNITDEDRGKIISFVQQNADKEMETE